MNFYLGEFQSFLRFRIYFLWPGSLALPNYPFAKLGNSRKIQQWILTEGEVEDRRMKPMKGTVEEGLLEFIGRY